MVESSPYSWFTLAAHFFKIANALMMGSCNGVNHVDWSYINSVLYENLNFHGANTVEFHYIEQKIMITNKKDNFWENEAFANVKSKNKS